MGWWVCEKNSRHENLMQSHPYTHHHLAIKREEMHGLKPLSLYINTLVHYSDRRLVIGESSCIQILEYFVPWGREPARHITATHKSQNDQYSYSPVIINLLALSESYPLFTRDDENAYII